MHEHNNNYYVHCNRKCSKPAEPDLQFKESGSSLLPLTQVTTNDSTKLSNEPCERANVTDFPSCVLVHIFQTAVLIKHHLNHCVVHVEEQRTADKK